MSFLDWLKNILSNDKKDAQIYVKTLKKTYGESEPLSIGLFKDKKPLTNEELVIEINGQKYTRVTDKDGIATLNINLSDGVYRANVEFEDDDFNRVTAFVDVVIEPKPQLTRMEGTDVNMTYKDGTQYKCAVYDESNNRIKDKVNITINGQTYTRTADNEGLYALNINLNEGRYDVNATFDGTKYFKPSFVNNTVIVNKKEEPKPQKLYPYLTASGGGQLGQITGYSCGPHSLMQCIYRLTGVEVSESKLMAVCGTTTSGTSHSGLESGLAWFNRTYGYNLKMEWKNFSDVGWDKLQEYIDTGAVFFHLLYRNQWGHYEVPKTNELVILNSLGSYCNYPSYCGYIESRSRATQQSYINGISQKSVCIIRR